MKCAQRLWHVGQVVWVGNWFSEPRASASAEHSRRDSHSAQATGMPKVFCPSTASLTGFRKCWAQDLRIPHNMVTRYPGAQSGFFDKRYVNFIYIPSSLLLVGCVITKPEWLPYAAVLALALGSWQYHDMRVFSSNASSPGTLCLTLCRASASPQAKTVPGIRAAGKDHRIP